MILTTQQKAVLVEYGYGVTWVPWIVFDGGFANTNVSEIQQKFDNSIDAPGLAGYRIIFHIKWYRNEH